VYSDYVKDANYTSPLLTSSYRMSIAYTAYKHICVAVTITTSLQCFDTVGRVEGQPACKKLEWRGTGMVICLEQDADLHMAQLMPLPLTVSCFSKIQTGFTFLVPAHPGCPGKRAVKRVCVCVTITTSH